jgi:hypothetical protein
MAGSWPGGARVRRTPWRSIWIALGAGFVIFMVAGIVLAGRDVPSLPPMQQSMIFKGGHYTNSRTTTKSWSFDYDRAQLSPDQTFGTIDGVHHGIIFRNGKPYLTLSAEHVSLNTQTLNFTATGKVHIVRAGADSSTTFDTDLIDWNNATKLLHMNHPSYVHTGGETLKVETILVDLNKDDVQLGKVDGDISAP